MKSLILQSLKGVKFLSLEFNLTNFRSIFINVLYVNFVLSYFSTRIYVPFYLCRGGFSPTFNYFQFYLTSDFINKTLSVNRGKKELKE